MISPGDAPWSIAELRRAVCKSLPKPQAPNIPFPSED